MNQWLKVKNYQNENKSRIDFYGDILLAKDDYFDLEEDKCPREISEALREINPTDDLDIYINSGGGSVFGGIAIYNILSRHKGKKTVYVDGLCASIATVIAMVGDEIVAGDGSLFMIHKPSMTAFGNADELLEAVELLDTCEKSIKDIYKLKIADESKLEQLNADMAKETWYSAEQFAEFFNVTIQSNRKAVAYADSKLIDEYKNAPIKQIEDKQEVEVSDEDKAADIANREEIERLRIQMEF